MIKRGRRAFTVIELMVASALTLTLFVASMMSLDSITRAQTASLLRSTGVTVAQEAMEKARLYSCGATEGSETFTVDQDKCLSIFDGAIPSDKEVFDASSYSGIMTRTTDVNEEPLPRDYFVSINYDYQNESSNACLIGSPETASSTSTRPTLLAYTVEVRWQIRGEWMPPVILKSTEPLPKSFRGEGSAIRVSFAEEGSRTVKLSGLPLASASGERVTIAERTTTSECAWFMNYTPGDYSEIRVESPGLDRLLIGAELKGYEYKTYEIEQ